MKNVPNLFGSMVFNDAVMQARLPKDVYKALKKTMALGTHLELDVANVVANAMKDWAVEHGATHYTHWFQPMTGVTAEKHDSFISPEPGGRVLMEFSGKELVRGEPDASSFPSGGLRATFEARGYTVWDITSYAFIKDGTLYIPTAFCSYSGEALDKKTPLLRSMEALDRQAMRILRLFGNTAAHRVITTVGPEQEYFLVDKAAYEKRPDLLYTGRTLFGARPPKGQELEDHYFGSIKPRVAAFMLEPGDTPHDNAQFLLFLCAVIQAVDDYQDLLRVSAASAGNDHRLGANEAPPAIISMFLGDELTEILKSLESGAAYHGPDKHPMEIGVTVLPHFPKDTTDRNRTSPFAFTGNKFEFRMLGSAFSIAGPNIVLNTVVAESLRQFADQLEASADFQADLAALIRKTIREHRRIVFNGNSYSDEWVAEAEGRGLSNRRSTVEALPAFVEPKSIEVFTRHHVFTETELRSRYEILLENYAKTLRIEALTMVDMVRRDVIPACVGYQNELLSLLQAKKACFKSGGALEEQLCAKIDGLCGCLMSKLEALEDALLGAPESASPLDEADYTRRRVFGSMAELRLVVDELETLVSKKYWTLPTYADLLYSVQ